MITVTYINEDAEINITEEFSLIQEAFSFVRVLAKEHAGHTFAGAHYMLPGFNVWVPSLKAGDQSCIELEYSFATCPGSSSGHFVNIKIPDGWSDYAKEDTP